jgi:hypothetical protein
LPRIFYRFHRRSQPLKMNLPSMIEAGRYALAAVINGQYSFSMFLMFKAKGLKLVGDSVCRGAWCQSNRQQYSGTEALMCLALACIELA